MKHFNLPLFVDRLTRLCQKTGSHTRQSVGKLRKAQVLANVAYIAILVFRRSLVLCQSWIEG